MRKRDLVEILEELEDDDEVRIAHQPSWPFEYSIDDRAMTVVDIEQRQTDLANSGDDDDGLGSGMPAGIEGGDTYRISYAAGNAPKKILYLAEGQQLGYLPGFIKDELGW